MSLYVCLPVHPSVRPSARPSVCISVSHSLSLSHHPSICSIVHLSLSLSLSGHSRPPPLCEYTSNILHISPVLSLSLSLADIHPGHPFNFYFCLFPLHKQSLLLLTAAVLSASLRHRVKYIDVLAVYGREKCQTSIARERCMCSRARVRVCVCV